MQKLKLIQCRIWGNTLLDGFSSGRKYFRIRTPTKHYDHYNFLGAEDFVPEMEKEPSVAEEKKQRILEKFNRRRHRVLMRGVKLGARKSSASNNSMSIFSKKI